ncbi:hypothetical protein [Geminocystis sp. GBBB08]|uniref:hypothetical protein n=1 Tax=Geminocystis sp. GBBB08 TaxID=2604140 RepID=UPI0027E2756E|nr:hypothetical protein [Geminocystis sp. GBBB08]MBL1209095.1 hypothetical protein [Geminocystis sp. GBBB08]
MNKFIKDINIKQYLIISISLIIPFLVYSSILMIDLPNNIGELIRHEVSWLLIIFAGLLYLSYSLKGWLGISLNLTTTLALFALPLARLWSTGVSESFLLAGLFPWSDANSYYRHTKNILQGLTMINSVHNSRPMFVGWLSFLLKLTEQNLQITIGIITVLIAIACFFLSEEIKEIYGKMAAILTVICLFIYIRPLIGSLMTENIGLCLGILSFALLLRGARQMNMNITLLGIFILTIALNARVGTFFVLPSLLLWGSYLFRTSKLFSEKFFGWGIVVILLGFILNSLLLKIIGHPETSSSYGNFAIMFYGVITETNWTQIYQDYPEINQLKGAEFSEKTNQILWQTIINNPTDSVKGIIKQWTNFFTNQYKSIFFIERNSLELILRFLGVIGLIFSLLNFKRNPVSSLILFYFLGVFASIPFAPIQDGGLRVYAATIVIFPILSAIGLYLLIYIYNSFIVRYIDNIILKNNYLNSKLKPLFFCHNSSDNSLNKLWINQDFVLPTLSLALVIISFFAPIFIKQINAIAHNSQLFCPVGLESAYFSYNSGSYINLVSDDARENSHLPNLRVSDFREGLKTFAPWLTDEPKALATLNENITIVDITIFNIFGSEFLIMPSELLPEKKGKIFVCGKRESIGQLNLFYGKNLKSISSKID